MTIKVLKKPTGIPFAKAAVSPGVNPMGAATVLAHLSAVDAHGMSDVCALLGLSSAEARDIAARFVRAADEADALAAAEAAGKAVGR